MGKIIVDADLCKSCGYCVKYCPQGIMSIGEAFNRNGYKYAEQTDQSKCTGCGICALMCPDTAISVYKE